MRSASSMSEASGWCATTLRTTPGPEMATLTLTSGSPLPCSAPAMNGLSSGTLQKTTSLAQPMQSLAAVSLESALMHVGHAHDGVHVDAGPSGGHVDRGAHALRAPIASGMASISAASPRVKPFCTMALKPPTKSMPISSAAASSACATSTKAAGSSPPTTCAMGVTDTRLLTMGMPYFSSISPATVTRRPARCTILAWMRSAVRCGSRSEQSASEMPMVTARTSRFSDWIMADGLEDLLFGDEDHEGGLLTGGRAARCGA